MQSTEIGSWRVLCQTWLKRRGISNEEANICLSVCNRLWVLFKTLLPTPPHDCTHTESLHVCRIRNVVTLRGLDFKTGKLEESSRNAFTCHCRNVGHPFPAPLKTMDTGQPWNAPSKHYACALQFQTAAQWIKAFIRLACPGEFM
jgi:hypothetical protein